MSSTGCPPGSLLGSESLTPPPGLTPLPLSAGQSSGSSWHQEFRGALAMSPCHSCLYHCQRVDDPILGRPFLFSCLACRGELLRSSSQYLHIQGTW